MRNDKVNLKLATLFVLCASTCGAFGQSNASFYVSTTGSDSNPGTQTAPWRTVQHAADTARAGSTVNVRGAVYEELVSITHPATRLMDTSRLEATRARRPSWTQSISLPQEEPPYLRSRTRATSESRALKFATSTLPNIGSLRWA
jgi:hypothetical protein